MNYRTDSTWKGAFCTDLIKIRNHVGKAIKDFNYNVRFSGRTGFSFYVESDLAGRKIQRKEINESTRARETEKKAVGKITK